jgi:hypothetical protein
LAPTVTVGVARGVPTVTVRRRAAPSPVDERFCADGPDIWPSAHGLAVGTQRFSRSATMALKRFNDTTSSNVLNMHFFTYDLLAIVKMRYNIKE